MSLPNRLNLSLLRILGEYDQLPAEQPYFQRLYQSIYSTMRGRSIAYAGLSFGIALVLAGTAWGDLPTEGFRLMDVMGMDAKIGLGLFCLSISGLFILPSYVNELNHLNRLFSKGIISKLQVVRLLVLMLRSQEGLDSSDKLINEIKELSSRIISPDDLPEIQAIIKKYKSDGKNS